MLEVNVKMDHKEIGCEVVNKSSCGLQQSLVEVFVINLLVSHGNEYHFLTRVICFPFQRIKENLNPNSEHFRTAIVALGHVAYNLPDKYPVHIKNIVSRKVMLMKFHLCDKPNETCHELYPFISQM